MQQATMSDILARVEREHEKALACIKRSIKQAVHETKFKHEYAPDELRRLDAEARFFGVRKRTDAPVD
jgi:hypothetical protein